MKPMIFDQVIVYSGLHRDASRRQVVNVTEHLQVRLNRGLFSVYADGFEITLLNAVITGLSEKEVELSGFEANDRSTDPDFQHRTVILTRRGTGWAEEDR